MNIVVKHRTNVEALRTQPEMVSRFGIISNEINKVLGRSGYEMVDMAPEDSIERYMAYLDIDSLDLYDIPASYPLELQMAISEVDTLDIEIEDDEVTRVDFKELDMDAAYHYETFGWSEELLSIWGLASRAANISLKQIRIAISSVSEIRGAAFIQVIKNPKTTPKFETIIIQTIEDFMATCESLDYLGIDVINVVINKPIPRSKTIVPISYAINPGKYINMKVRDMG